MLNLYQAKTEIAVSKEHRADAIRLASLLKRTYNNNPQGLITLLQSLINAKPISLDVVAEAFGYPSMLLRGYFKLNPPSNFDFDENGNVIGAGLTLKKTKHQVSVDEHTMYTWCAIDTILFPVMLKQTFQVKSPCPITGTEISLTVAPSGISKLTPEDAVTCFLIPDDSDSGDNIQHSFCQFANFFANQDAANQWKKQHPKAFILTCEQAFQFAVEVVGSLNSPQPKSTVGCTIM